MNEGSAKCLHDMFARSLIKQFPEKMTIWLREVCWYTAQFKRNMWALTLGTTLTHLEDAYTTERSSPQVTSLQFTYSQTLGRHPWQSKSLPVDWQKWWNRMQVSCPQTAIHSSESLVWRRVRILFKQKHFLHELKKEVSFLKVVKICDTERVSCRWLLTPFFYLTQRSPNTQIQWLSKRSSSTTGSLDVEHWAPYARCRPRDADCKSSAWYLGRWLSAMNIHHFCFYRAFVSVLA